VAIVPVQEALLLAIGKDHEVLPFSDSVLRAGREGQGIDSGLSFWLNLGRSFFPR
jgi:hypothetical protein